MTIAALEEKMTATREAARPDTQSLGPVVTEKNERIAEYKRRKPRLHQKRVASEDVAPRLTNGWVVRRKLPKGRVILEKQKAPDEILENRFWCILYQFGFDELNRGRQFQISVTSGGKLVNKQVDVFAKINDVVIITECKYCEKKQGISFQADIDDFASLQRPIASSLRKHYGTNSKLKIVWLFVTGNVIWSEADRARAKAQNIQIIEERELRYFEEIAKNVGPAAKYQFLGEFLSDQRIPALSNYSVPAIRTKLGGNWAYYFWHPQIEFYQ
jgi:DNA sulfur modification protein DndB